MKHKVKVTVLDKKFIPNYSTSTVPTQIQVLVPVIMWAMNLSFIVTATKMIFGIWDLTHWLRLQEMPTKLQAVRKYRFVPKRGTLFHAISTRDCRAVL